MWGVVVSRLNAAYRVLARYHWSRFKSIRFRRPIFSDDPSEPIGYFDRIKAVDGCLYLDGWVRSRELVIDTNLETTVIRPDIPRADAPYLGGATGFSTKIDGTQMLRYQVSGQRAARTVSLASPITHLWQILVSLILLAPFGWNNRKDIIAYMCFGDPLAGDRLESGLNARRVRSTFPRATQNLFQPTLDAIRVAEQVDIIVPVHNAYEATRKCLVCLAAYTPALHRIHLVDDASTDPRIRPMLRNWASGKSNVRLVENEVNVGFVGVVNSVLKIAEHHVVLLNSDAFVTRDWVDRLIAPILADDSVASVTPLSNAGEILSIPFICEKSHFDDGDAERIDNAVSRLNLEASCVSLPTGVGFCLALSRRWLDVEPSFDPIFGKGYGEEVDWCRRVAARGGRNVGLGNLFVEHIGASSFGSLSAGLKRDHNKIITDRFPHFEQQVLDFRHSDPMIGPRLVATLALISDGSPLPVYLAHDAGGGAEMWLQTEVRKRAKRGQPVAIVRSHQTDGPVSLEIAMGENSIKGLVGREDLMAYLAVPDRIEMIYSCLAMTAAPLEILRLCRDALRARDKLKVLFHDYFPICPSHNLIGANGKFCGLPAGDACASCYAKHSAANATWPRTIGQWQEEWLPLLERADSIVAFSSASRDLILRNWPHLADSIGVEPHSMDWLPQRIASRRSGRSVIGVLGAVGYQKGADVLRRLAQAMRGEFDIVVIGDFDESFSNPGIRVHGKYQRSEISALAQKYKVDFWFIPSIWPETFCYAARECLATGLPVVGFDLGAQGEALRASGSGVVLPTDSSTEEIVSTFRILASRTDRMEPQWIKFPPAIPASSHPGTPLVQ